MKLPASERRRDFAAMIVEKDVLSARALLEVIKTAGYGSISFYPTLEAAASAAVVNPPHFLIADFASFADEIEGFLQKIESVSSEILSILLVRDEHAILAHDLISRGLAYDAVSKPFASSLELIQTLDRAASQLFFQFESEQLRERLGEDATSMKPQAVAAAPTLGNDAAMGSGIQFISRIESIRDIDSTVRLCLEELSAASGEVPSLYFEYLPAHASLLISQSNFLPLEKYRGLGIHLKENTNWSLTQLKLDPSSFSVLSEMIREVFGMSSFQARAHVIDGEMVGIFVVLSKQELSVRSLLALKAFEITYRRNQVMKEKHALDTRDPITGLLNQRNFVQKVGEEVARSRRIFFPVSLVTLRVDRHAEINGKFGQQQVDVVAKVIAALLKKMTRVSDIVAKTSADGFSIIMPHTSNLGAAMKAERLRRIIQSTNFPNSESLGAITVSVGVSEYPSFSSDGETLISTAEEALEQVHARGGDKVCLATAPEGFKMDFEPREVPSIRFNHDRGAP